MGLDDRLVHELPHLVGNGNATLIEQRCTGLDELGDGRVKLIRIGVHVILYERAVHHAEPAQER